MWHKGVKGKAGAKHGSFGGWSGRDMCKGIAPRLASKRRTANGLVRSQPRRGTRLRSTPALRLLVHAPRLAAGPGRV